MTIDEKMKKARAAKAKKNPPQYKTIDAGVLLLNEDHPFSMKNVRKYIDTQRSELSMYKKLERQGEKGATAKVANAEAYIRIAERYLRTGLWTDAYYGEHQEKKLNGGFWEAPMPKR